MPDLMVKFDWGAMQNILSVREQAQMTMTKEVTGTAFEDRDSTRVTDK